MKYEVIKKYILLQMRLGLYVAEAHYFDAKGKRQLTFTDKEDLAEQMTLEEINEFLNLEKNAQDYEIYESQETEYEEASENEED